MSKADDKLFDLGPGVEKRIKASSDIPNFEDKILISNPNKYFLYCEGKTDEKYFKRLKSDYFCSSRLAIKLFKPNQKNHDGSDAKSLVDQCIIKKEEKTRDEDYNDSENKFFLIFDRDNNCKEPEKNDEKHLDYCLRKCRENSITPIFSNPCFEVWLICQYKKPEKSTFPSEPKKTKKLYNQIKRLPANKSLNANPKLVKRITNAKINAKKIHDERIHDGIEIYSPDSYPLTEVFRLIKLLEKELDV